MTKSETEAFSEMMAELHRLTAEVARLATALDTLQAKPAAATRVQARPQGNPWQAALFALREERGLANSAFVPRGDIERRMEEMRA